jgi:hypothetical protein
MKKTIFVFTFLFVTFAAFAQSDNTSDAESEDFIEDAFTAPESHSPTNAVHRGEPVTIQDFDRNALKEITGGIDYTEKSREREKPNEQKRESTGKPPVVSEPWGGDGLRWLGYLVIIGAVVYFLFIIIKNTSTRPANQRFVINNLQGTHPVENIEELEIDRLMREARGSGNYRLMIRIQYLALLKALHVKGLIKWERDKTNREYTMELLSREVLYHDFRKLTLAYETVWYGEHVIDSETCQVILSGFETVQQQLSTRS